MVFHDATFRFCLAGSALLAGTLLLAGCGDEDGTKSPIQRKHGKGGETSDTGGSGGSSAGTAGTSSVGRGGSMQGEAGEGGEPGDLGGMGGSSAGTSSTDPGGAGGAGGADDPGDPSLVGPRDKTVVEGMPYAFEAAITQPTLRYEWQSAPNALAFVTIPDATTSRYESPTSTLSEDNSRFRVLAQTASGTLTSRIATLHVLPLTSGAFVSLDSGAAHEENHSSLTWTTDTYAGAANLGAGTLGAVARTPDSMAGAAAYLDVIFYNNTEQPITVPDGSISARVHGVYAGNTASSTSSMLIHAVLNAYPYATAAITHQVSINFANNVPVNVVHTLTDSGNTNARVDVTTESMSEIDVDLVLGAFDVPPLRTVWLTFHLTANSYFGTTDFSGPSTLEMTLPEGVDFDTNAIVPLEWVTVR